MSDGEDVPSSIDSRPMRMSLKALATFAFLHPFFDHMDVLTDKPTDLRYTFPRCVMTTRTGDSSCDGYTRLKYTFMVVRIYKPCQTLARILARICLKLEKYVQSDFCVDKTKNALRVCWEAF